MLVAAIVGYSMKNKGGKGKIAIETSSDRDDSSLVTDDAEVHLMVNQVI